MDKEQTTTVILVKDHRLLKPLRKTFPNALIIWTQQISEPIEWFFVPNF